MQFVALKECPQGQQPGEVFEATEEAGSVLVMVGAAKVADTRIDETHVHTTKPKRTYARRDMSAEPS